MLNLRNSDNEAVKRDIPSFIEPRPPLISNPFMRPRPQKCTNLLELLDDMEYDEPDLVQVYLRLKPCKNPSNLYDVRSERSLLTSLDTTTAGHGRRTQHNVSKMYTFSHIFGPDSSQKEIFEHVVKDNLRKLREGNSFTLLTYGASGSGKTFTLMGTVASPGLVPRALEYVFKVVDAAQTPVYKPDERGTDCLSYAEQEYELQWVKRLRHISAPVRDKYRRMSIQLSNDLTASNLDLSNRSRHYVWVSFIEIYNEGIYDLLAPGDRRNATRLAIREDTSGNVYVKGATQAFVRSGEEAYDVMVAGKHNLQVAATGIHAHSSRSHCIFTITMLTETEGGMRSACVRLCDLAGSERAARTRNTGARMHESRAINSSLHVLERCLRMLRRKRTAATVVPYRESKLTRLLGAGLSGTRGEAVSMVVTINPSPEYASETKHVLQLAAVAKDIQINNTVSDYPSSLESSTQDTTVGCSSTEVMRLRADNERLHFELIQAQSRIKELLSCIEEKQAAAAGVMTELVEEAKASTTEYYEGELVALRTEMGEMMEEYESRLKNATQSSQEDKDRAMQDQIDQLMTEIAVLKEKLSAERLARAREEEELQHLRACIEERDEHAEGQTPFEDVISLSDSDGEEDPSNESLEPTIKREDINRSRIIRRSIIAEQRNFNNSIKKNNTTSENSSYTLKEHDERDEDNVSEYICDTDENAIRQNPTDDSSVDNTSENNDSVLEKSSATLKGLDEEDDNNVSDCTHGTSAELSNTADISNESNCQIPTNEASNKSDTSNKEEVNTSANKANISRGTYFINVDNNNTIDKDVVRTQRPVSRETYCVTNLEHSTVSNSDHLQEDNISGMSLTHGVSKLTIDKPETKAEFVTPIILSDTYRRKLIGSVNQSVESNNSLVQFERLELESETLDGDKRRVSDRFSHIKLCKGQKSYFDEDNRCSKTPVTVIKSKMQKKYFDVVNEDQERRSNLDIVAKTSRKNSYFENIVTETNKKTVDSKLDVEIDGNRSPSNEKEDVINDCEPNTNKKLLGEVITEQVTSKTSVKIQGSIDIFEELDSPHVPTKRNIDIGVPDIIRTETNNDSAKLDKRFVLIDSNLDSKEKEDIPDSTCLTESENTAPAKHLDAQADEISNDEKILIEFKNEDIVAQQIDYALDISNNKEPHLQENSIEENTLIQFDNIYKDITAPRTTEFDLLFTDESKNLCTEEKQNNNTVNTENIGSKYSLRKKLNSEKPKTERKRRKNKDLEGEILLESVSNASQAKPTKRNLRMPRRQKNVNNENVETENKLKDIANLQMEFCDVTMDVPAQTKPTTDIPSPEKVENDENSPIVTRSRRKLFTPRAEPLEESSGQLGDSSERVRVLRPSYHRLRARRKL